MSLKNIERNLGEALSNLRQRKISQGGREWIEASYEFASWGIEYSVLRRLSPIPGGSVIAVATFPADVRADYEPAVLEVLDSFSLLTPAEMDDAILATLKPGPDSRVYHGTAGESIRLGNNWRRSEELAASPVMNFQLDDRAFITVEIEEFGAARPKTTADYVDALLANIRAEAGNSFALDDKTSITIAGKPWVRLRYHFVDEGWRVQATAHFYVTPKRAFQLIGITHLQTAVAHDRVIAPAVEGFKFP